MKGSFRQETAIICRWTDSNRSSSGFVFLYSPVLRCDDLRTPGPKALVQVRRCFPSPWLATAWGHGEAAGKQRKHKRLAHKLITHITGLRHYTCIYAYSLRGKQLQQRLQGLVRGKISSPGDSARAVPGGQHSHEHFVR